MLYWDKLVTKMVGNKEWNEAVRYYTTISDATLNSMSDEKLVTFSDEAMILILWENALERWKQLFDWEQIPENKGKTKPRINGKFLHSNTGQQKWGGWKLEGYKAFNKYYKAVEKGRKSKTCALVEKTCLEELRKQNKVITTNAQSQANLNKRNKRALKKGINLEEMEAIEEEEENDFRLFMDLVDEDSDDEDDDSV